MGFNLSLMLIVDLLHEFELGVWKAILTHLLHMVESLRGTVLAELDHWCDNLLVIVGNKADSACGKFSPGPYFWSGYHSSVP